MKEKLRKEMLKKETRGNKEKKKKKVKQFKR